MILPDAAWRSREGLADLVATLGGGRTTMAVGGAVRDTLLDLEVSDIDLATRLPPTEVIARLKSAGVKVVPTGLKHGTVTAVTAGGPVEVTTLRRDVATDGRHAEVAFSQDWREDASRRDFTINALYADLASGTLFDWFGGVDDARARRVRFIGEPLVRIAEDHLRILRFFRFHARFGQGEPDAPGLAACVERANDLMALSRERIASELLKLLVAAEPVPVVATMIAGGILRPVLPEITEADRLARLVERERTMAVAADPIRRLAALVPHEQALDIARRLKLSNAQAKRLVAATATEGGGGSAAALAYRLGTDAAVDRLLLGNGSRAEVDVLAEWQRPALPVTGGKLIARGLTPGPAVAQTLKDIECEWVDAGFPEGERLENIVATHLGGTRLA